jgi:hypothetical protein
MITLFENYKNHDDIIKELLKINEPYISATEMYNSKEIQQILNFEELDDYYISNEKNYKDSIYFHVNTNNTKDLEYSGVGHGFYLGKDPIALKRFYDLDDVLSISEYQGNIKWLNLMLEQSFKRFKEIFKQHDIDIINSYEVSKIILKMGYDGIRYYDAYATGEEFVLFDMEKIRKV